jgi:hypothetical protein
VPPGDVVLLDAGRASAPPSSWPRRAAG